MHTYHTPRQGERRKKIKRHSWGRRDSEVIDRGIYLSFSIIFSVSPSLSLSRAICLSLFLPLCISLCLSLCLSVSLSLFLCLSLFPHFVWLWIKFNISCSKQYLPSNSWSVFTRNLKGLITLHIFTKLEIQFTFFPVI